MSSIMEGTTETAKPKPREVAITPTEGYRFPVLTMVTESQKDHTEDELSQWNPNRPLNVFVQAKANMKDPKSDFRQSKEYTDSSLWNVTESNFNLSEGTGKLVGSGKPLSAYWPEDEITRFRLFVIGDQKDLSPNLVVKSVTVKPGFHFSSAADARALQSTAANTTWHIVEGTSIPDADSRDVDKELTE